MNPRAHEVKVVDVVAETADAVTITFDIPPDVDDRFRYAPGQFVTVRVPSERTGSVARCYSLCSSPHSDERLAVTVKRTPSGYASNWLCDNVVEGAVLTVLEPAGTFVPRSLDRDMLLCAAGSGITPVMSIATSMVCAGTGDVALLYANRDPDSVIFARRLAAFGSALTVQHWLESERGLPSVAGLAELLEPYRDRDTYLCGPAGFMTTTRAALANLGVPERRIVQEQYRSLDDNPFETPRPAVTGSGGGTTLEVEIDGQTHTFAWPRNKKLLDVLLDAGIDAPYVCRESACATCVCSVRDGRTRMIMNESLIDEEIDAGLTLACQTLPESERVRIAFDQ